MTNPSIWMARALTLAEMYKRKTAPNPSVGAVLVKRGRLIGQGVHEGPGRLHAEVAALEDAKARGFDPSGAVLFVTLEPCCHSGTGKRMPPCAQNLIEQGIAEVYAAVPDPNPAVAGRGMALLASAGIATHWGPETEKAHKLIADFTTWITGHRPFVRLKWAQTLDGRAAARDGSSRWITGAESQAESHAIRASVDAVVIGAGTLIADDPSLTVREAVGRQPTRFVVAGDRPLPRNAKVFTDDFRYLTWIVADPAKASYERALSLCGDQVLPWDGRDWTALGRAFLRAGFHYLMIEGGPSFLASCIKAGWWDTLTVFVAPTILADGLAVPGSLGVTTITHALGLAHPQWRTSGRDAVVEAWNVAVHPWTADGATIDRQQTFASTVAPLTAVAVTQDTATVSPNVASETT